MPLTDMNAKRDIMNAAIDDYEDAIDAGDQTEIDNAKAALETAILDYSTAAKRAARDPENATREPEAFFSSGLFTATQVSNTADAITNGSRLKGLKLRMDTEGYGSEAAGQTLIEIPLDGVPKSSRYGFFVKWGDGEITTHKCSEDPQVISHDYSSPGVYDIEIVGTIAKFRGAQTTDQEHNLKEVLQWGDGCRIIDHSNMLSGYNDIMLSASDTPTFESGAKMDIMFSGTYIGNYGELANWDTSNVESMVATFAGNQSFDEDLSGWDVGNVTDYDDFAVQTGIDGTAKMPNFS